jgi:hypothetical protein
MSVGRQLAWSHVTTIYVMFTVHFDNIQQLNQQMHIIS